MSRPISAPTAEEAARLYKALADPIRLRLVSLVRFATAGEVNFDELSDEFDMPQSSLSHHLRILVDAGILRRERRRTWSWYSLQDLPLQVAYELLRPGGPLRGCAVDPLDQAQPSSSSASRPRTRRSMSSRIGRTASTD